MWPWIKSVSLANNDMGKSSAAIAALTLTDCRLTFNRFIVEGYGNGTTRDYKSNRRRSQMHAVPPAMLEVLNN
jgi:hypothetical protein